MRNRTGLTALLKELYDPQSSNFHKYLSVEQFTNGFGPTQADYDAVVAWAKSNGLNVTQTTSNRHIVDVEGEVAAINSAFNLTETQYRDPAANRIFYAPDREPTVINLTVQLLFVEGLDNFDPPHSNAVTSSAPSSPFGSAPNGCYLPSDFRQAYYGTGPLTGAGQTVGIVSLNGFNPLSLSQYYADAGTVYPNVPVTIIPVDGFNTVCSGDGDGNGTCDDTEQIMDIVSVVGMAPGLTQVLFYETFNNASIVNDLLNKMAVDNTAKVLSSSWNGSGFAFADAIFQEFAAQGQSYFNSSGDSGAYNSSTNDTPGLDPYITVVGGTNLAAFGSGSWVSETGWGTINGCSDSGGNPISCGSGGGYGTYPIPYWQTLPNVINSSNSGSTSLRNSPDVAADAGYGVFDMNNGVPLGHCEGGTSHSAPLWAGFIALANQQSVANNSGTLGFINPQLYSIGASRYSTAFHDVISGSNNLGSGGFSAALGYDLVTGWGSPSPALIDALVVPLPSEVMFQETLGYATQSLSYDIVAGDFTGDGKPDLVSTNYNAGTVSVFSSHSGGLLNQIPYNAGGFPVGIAAGDFRGNGRLDIAVANNLSSGTVTLLLNDGYGAFSTSKTTGVGVAPQALAIGDFNRDGKLDLVVTNNGSANISVLLGNGDGSFSRPPGPAPATGSEPIQIAVGDFRHNGKLDLAIANSNSNTVSVLLGNGDGTFQTQATYAVGSIPVGIALGDLNGDGKLDIVVTNAGSSSVSVLYANGDGTFQKQSVYPAGSSPQRVSVADLNGDGFPDIVVTNKESTSVGVLLGNRYHTFQSMVSYPTVANPNGIAIADVNGDGRSDIAVTSASSGSVYLLLNGISGADLIFKNGFELN